MAGDTVLVQEILKGKLTKLYLMGKTRENNNISTSSSGGTKVTSVWSWLGDLFDVVVSALEWVGWQLGIPGCSGWDSELGHYTINTWDFSWLTGGGGGGGGGSGYSGAGYPVYDAYLPGLYPSPNYGDPVQQPSDLDWGIYPLPHGPNVGNVPATPLSYDYLVSVLNLTPEQMQFLLLDTNGTADALYQYLRQNGETLDNLQFAEWAVGYLNDFNDADFNELININNIQNSTINLPLLDVCELGSYPQFKSLVENLPQFLNGYPNILKALSYTTGFSEKKIKQLMQPGKGPRVRVVANLKDSEGIPTQGHFNPTTNPKVLEVDAGYVNGLEVVNSTFRKQAIGLILVLATLHEFVHFGRDANGLPSKITDVNSGIKIEAGWYFEGTIQPPTAPGYLEPTNAKEWLNYYKIKLK